MVARLDERYRRGEKLGSGGMSQVFKAWDTRLKRDVAIKILHDHLAEKEESRRRFSREAEAVAKLHHPNILEIFDFSTEDGRESFIVTEYIKGRTLRDFGDEHRFQPPELAAMAVHELACALEHAHQKGVIHRDLKPENVMIREDGILKLMDFGIAKVLDEGDRMTMTGALVGSPAHMAPEIIEGQPATAAADIFSLGTILYWLCCHKLPFLGANPTQTLKLILDATYPDPRQTNPAVSDELAAIIGRCLAREPAGRYESAGHLREALAAELARNGIEDPARECAAFFKEPAASADKLKASLIDRLLGEAEQSARGPDRNYARAMKVLNRVLALEENNARALGLMDATRLSQRRRRRLKEVFTGALVLVGLALVSSVGVVGFETWRTRAPQPAMEVPPPAKPKPPALPVPANPDSTRPEVAVATPDKPAPETPKPPPKGEFHGPALDKGHKPKPVEVAVVKPPTPNPEPLPAPKPAEVRNVELNLEPPVFTAKVRFDDSAHVESGKPHWFQDLPVGAHLAHVECPGCDPAPIAFTVQDSQSSPVLRPVTLRLRYRAQLEMAVEDGTQQVLIDGRPMVAGADPKLRTLDFVLPEGKTAKTVTVVVIREGRSPSTFTQDVAAGRKTALRQP